MGWSPILGVGIFWIGLIVAIILYAVKRKWNPVMYLISVCLYIFTAGFIMDAFDLERTGILIILAFSTLLMILLGLYISVKMRE